MLRDSLEMSILSHVALEAKQASAEWTQNLGKVPDTGAHVRYTTVHLTKVINKGSLSLPLSLLLVLIINSNCVTAEAFSEGDGLI